MAERRHSRVPRVRSRVRIPPPPALLLLIDGSENLPKPAIAENACGSGLPRSNLRKLQIAVTGPSQNDGRCDENPAVPPCRTEVHSITPRAVSSLVERGDILIGHQQ